MIISARMEETSVNKARSSKENLKLISIELTQMDTHPNHQKNRLYEDLVCLHTISILYLDYLLMSLSECNRNYILENCQWMTDLEDLHSIVSNHFIITSQYQGTRFIIISSTKCTFTKCNGL